MNSSGATNQCQKEYIFYMLIDTTFFTVNINYIYQYQTFYENQLRQRVVLSVSCKF